MSETQNPETRKRRFLRRFLSRRLATAALVLILLLHLAAFIGPMFYAASPYAIKPMEAFAPPSMSHPLGTDEAGRDVLARLLHGGRISLFVGFAAMIVAVVLGTTVGAITGFSRGWPDAVLMRLTDALISLPTFFLLLLGVAFFGGSITTLALIIGLTSWMGVARVIRSEFIRWRSHEMTNAARVIGASNMRIAVGHIFPQTTPSLIVAASLGVAVAILAEAAMSFLGLGITPPTPSWGNMLTNSQRYIYAAPWLSVYPGLMIFLTVLGYNFLGDGVRDVLDPYGSRQE